MSRDLREEGPKLQTNVVLIVNDIYKHFGDLEVLKGISFSIREGKTKAIIGPSGSGKSTLLRCINWLTPPDRGRILLSGVEIGSSTIPIAKFRQQIGMVFQHFNLFVHLSALENVRLCLRKVKGMSKKDATERAIQLLARVGLSDKATSYPAQLSGGQQQRVGIARALALDPKIILFDEPTSALDPELIGEVLGIITDLARGQTTMLVVTHEMGFAQSVCDELIFMEAGKIVEQGPPNALLFNPTQERTRAFLGKINELYAHGSGE